MQQALAVLGPLDTLLSALRPPRGLKYLSRPCLEPSGVRALAWSQYQPDCRLTVTMAVSALQLKVGPNRETKNGAASGRVAVRCMVQKCVCPSVLLKTEHLRLGGLKRQKHVSPLFWAMKSQSRALASLSAQAASAPGACLVAQYSSRQACRLVAQYSSRQACPVQQNKEKPMLLLSALSSQC